MRTEYVESLRRVKDVPFTALDFYEGLECLEPVARRAVVFGMEQGLEVDQVIEMTHAGAATLDLTPFAEAAVLNCTRHIRLRYVFWGELPGGLLSPLLNLDDDVRSAFGGMSWADLAGVYKRMVWVDQECDAEHFLMLARQHGLL